jgi:hypothetical protein
MVSGTISRAAGLGLVLTLAVVVAAAGIRHGADPSILRPVHRVAATLVVPAALWMAWKSFSPLTFLAVVLTLVLSIVGILGGKAPPPWIAATNLLGGLALAALFAWIAGAAREGRKWCLTPFLALLAMQAALGAGISIGGERALVPALHAMAGLALLALAAAAGRRALAALLALAVLAGFTALQYEGSGAAAFLHAATVALLAAAASLTPIKAARAQPAILRQ